MNDSTGRTSSTYDAATRLITVTNPANLRITYSYDRLSERTQMTDPTSGGVFKYAWDAAGRSQSVQDPQSLRTTFSYDNADRMIVARLGNGAAPLTPTIIRIV